MKEKRLYKLSFYFEVVDDNLEKGYLVQVFDEDGRLVGESRHPGKLEDVEKHIVNLHKLSTMDKIKKQLKNLDL